MIRFFSIFFIHRFLLLLVALIVLTLNLSPHLKKSSNSFKKKMEITWGEFLQRLEDAPETRLTLKYSKSVQIPSLENSLKYPYLWVIRFLGKYFQFSSLIVLIFLTNLFFVLYLWLTAELLSRIGPVDLGFSVLLLVCFLPTSFLFNMVSYLPLYGCLFSASILLALNNQWLACGVLSACLSLVCDFGIGIFPLLIFIFIYFQRYFEFSQVIGRALLLVLPIVGAIYLKGDLFLSFYHCVSHSAFFELYSRAISGKGLFWTMAHSMLGGSIVVVLLILGGILALVLNTALLDRLIPIYLVVWVFFTSPQSELAWRAPLAGIALEGISLVSRRVIVRLLMLLMLILGIFEVAWFFNG